MSYTSSALSFLLEDLGKTVIVTGAQIPLSQLRNDATDNLLGALMISSSYIIPGLSSFVSLSPASLTSRRGTQSAVFTSIIRYTGEIESPKLAPMT